MLNWPTKAACTSPQSGGAAVWAPSVVPGRREIPHVRSVGNEVWTGVADHPLGPWRDANGGKPLVPREYKPGFHMIDAEAFVDDDGTPWLYWGSGHGWKNGKCWAVKLNRDMSAFDGEPRDVTPTNYFEGPIMVKRHGHYFLMYSQGVTIKDTYQVHYAVGDNPLGPFKEGPGSPILVTDRENNVISPGHHTVFQFEGRDYILYHRHSIPFNEDSSAARPVWTSSVPSERKHGPGDAHAYGSGPDPGARSPSPACHGQRVIGGRAAPGGGMCGRWQLRHALETARPGGKAGCNWTSGKSRRWPARKSVSNMRGNLTIAPWRPPQTALPGPLWRITPSNPSQVPRWWPRM